MDKLQQAQLFLNFYFAPWGAAKGEVWEWITDDAPFEEQTAVAIVENILKDITLFTEEDIKSMKIIVPDS